MASTQFADWQSPKFRNALDLIPAAPAHLCRLTGKIAPLTKGDLLEVMLAFQVHPSFRAPDTRVRAICYPSEVEIWSAAMGRTDAWEIAHQFAHALYHTHRDGFYLCGSPAFAGCAEAEEQADCFASLLVARHVLKQGGKL